MTTAFYLLFGFQGLFMVIDEFYFHKRREMPRWERIGHPVDTLFFMLALSLIFFRGTDIISISASVLSSLIIAKDEWVHARLSLGGEQFLHALLFILHPTILVLAHVSAPAWGLEVLLVVILFFFYQTYYWNFYDKRLA